MREKRSKLLLRTLPEILIGFVFSFLLAASPRVYGLRGPSYSDADIGAESGSQPLDCDPCQYGCWLYQNDLLDCDYDHDGWTEEQGDCRPWDGSVNPGALESPSPTPYDCDLCWDTKDNDCDGTTDLSDFGCYFGGACGGTPIVIDTQGNDFRLVGLSAGVQFDLFGNGHPIRLGWIQGDDALLALDRNGNDVIDNGHELFGNVTRLQSGRHAQNGFQALAEFDSNADNVIDARDPVFPLLRLWLDRNVNGVTNRGELATLAQHQIIAIDLDYRESRRRDQWGNEFRYRAKVHRVGPTGNRFCYDVIFVTR